MVSTTAKDFLADIEQRFVKNEKTEMGNLLKKFCSKQYSGSGSIREYIMEMVHMVSKLRNMKLDVSDDMLVVMILISLPPKFGHFIVSYNCQKDKWTVKFNRLPELIVKSIAADINPEYVEITMLDPKTNRHITKTYYTSTLTYGVQRYDRSQNLTYYEGCTFNITER